MFVDMRADAAPPRNPRIQRRSLLVVAMCALMACSSPPSADPAPAPQPAPAPSVAPELPPTTDDRMKVIARAGSRAQVESIAVPGLSGVALFRVVRPGSDTGEGAAVVAGEDGVRFGADAMRAAVERAGRDDHQRLARLAVALLHPEAGVALPGARLDGDLLIYMWRSRRSTGPTPLQARLDLRTLVIDDGPPPSTADAVDRAIHQLGDDAATRRLEAIDLLAGRPSDPRVGVALSHAIKHHPDPAMRARAARAAAGSHDVTAATLGSALITDPEPDVRAAIAVTLGARGTTEAEQLLRSSLPVQTHPSPRAAIRRALDRIVETRP